MDHFMDPSDLSYKIYIGEYRGIYVISIYTYVYLDLYYIGIPAGLNSSRVGIGGNIGTLGE